MWLWQLCARTADSDCKCEVYSTNTRLPPASRPPLALWGAAFTEAWAQLAATLLGFAQVASYAAKAVFGPPFIAFLDLMLLLQRLVMPLVQVSQHVSSSMVATTSSADHCKAQGHGRISSLWLTCTWLARSKA